MIIEPILANWQVKLVALFLALALWFYTSGQASVERNGLSVKVPEDAVQGLPSDYQVIAITPSEFTIDVSGPLTVLREVRPEIMPTLLITGEALERGEMRFPISNRILNLDPDVRIQGVHPQTRELLVTFGKVVREPFQVDVPDLTDVPPGLDPTTRLDRTRVTVSGPRGALDALRERAGHLRPEAVSFKNVDPKLAQARTERVQLQFTLPVNVHVDEPVVAAIDLRPVAATRQVSLPVQLLVPRDFFHRFDIELSQPQVAVTLSGAQNLLTELKLDDLVAYVNLRRNVEPGATQELPVQLVGPSWLTWDPVTIRVTVVLASKPAPTPTLPEKGAARDRTTPER